MGTTSIDYAVSGFVRHRFVRALWASLFVTITLSIFVSWLQVAFSPSTFEMSNIVVSIISMPFLLMFIALLIFSVKFVADAIQGTHRRLTALVLTGGWAVLLYLLALQLPQPIIWQGEDIGWDVAAYTPAQAAGAAVTLLLRVSGLVLAFEAFRQALWQLTLNRDGFLAARGWRPSSGVGSGGFRRMLGLPGYITRFKHGGTRLALIYYVIALINVALVAAPLAPFALVRIQSQWGEDAALYGVGGLIGLLVLLVLVGWALGRFAERTATHFYQEVREWDTRLPIIFLRTFDQDDRCLRVRAADPIVKLPAGVGRARTLDEILLEHATPYGPVIGIGDPRDPTPPLGAARIFVPGQGLAWQEWVKGLVDASKAVVMCPNDTEGVKWELALLAHGDFAHRLIYLANPELPHETNLRLFAGFAPAGAAPEIRRGQIPIAAFTDPDKGWRVVTARAPSVEAYSIGLNLALQRLFGLAGVPIDDETSLIGRAPQGQLMEMGADAMAKGDFAHAMEAYQEAAQIARATEDTQAEAQRLTLTAAAALQIGRLDIAAPAVTKARQIYDDAPESPRKNVAECAKVEALLRDAENQPEEARVAWTRARDIYAEIGDDAEAAACAQRLSQS